MKPVAFVAVVGLSAVAVMGLQLYVLHQHSISAPAPTVHVASN